MPLISALALGIRGGAAAINKELTSTSKKTHRPNFCKLLFSISENYHDLLSRIIVNVTIENIYLIAHGLNLLDNVDKCYEVHQKTNNTFNFHACLCRRL